MIWIVAICLLSWAVLLWMRGDFWRIEEWPEAGTPKRWPDVVAVVPARDEAAGIGVTVTSLLSQDYPASFRVIVVDDHSSDGTADVARQAAAAIGAGDRLQVISGQDLPEGWTGKVWAMEQGLTQVGDSAQWVLFTDGDIEHAPGQLQDLVARGETQNYDLVSLMVRLSCQSWVEKTLIPAFVYFFRMLYPFRWVADPGSTIAGAAGGVMLVRRSFLARLGGMSVLKGALIDDCTLAKAVKGNMGRLWLGLASQTRSLRVYSGWAEPWRMIARSAYDQLNHSPLLLVGTVLAMAIIFILPPFLILSGWVWSGALAWALMARSFRPMVAFYGLPVVWALALPAIAVLYLGATLHSAYAYYRGRGGQWKGRVEGGRAAQPVTAATTRTKDSENFPVGSWLVAAHLRPTVHAYYQFAREADDISDDPQMPSDEKLRRLDQMDAQLQGAEGDGSAANIRNALVGTAVPLDHCRDLLVAFKRDSVKPRTRDWADLMDYCRYSASPVGRFLLDLHGESRDTWGPGDALCNALQVLNHLQDCRDDFIQLDRVYLPQDLLSAAGASAEDLRLPHATEAIRQVMDQMLDQTYQLLIEARKLTPMVKNGGLRRETAIIVAVAERLLDLLRHNDPLAQRVKLNKGDYVIAVITGLGRSIVARGK